MSIAQGKQDGKAAGGITLYDGGVYLVDGQEIVPEAEAAKVKGADRERGCQGRGQERDDRLAYFESITPPGTWTG